VPGVARDGVFRVNGRALAPTIAALSVVAFAHDVAAFADGETPVRIVDVAVFGDAATAGNTLMQHDGSTNFALLPTGSQANIGAVDPDATVVRAFLFWAGSEDLNFGADRNVDFTLPSGAFFNNLSVDAPVAGETLSADNRCSTRFFSGTPFFSCRRDVTFLLTQLGAGAFDGNYQVSDVNARPGNCATDPGTCQAMFGGWSIVIFWQSPTHPVRRDLVLYDSFFAVDEQNPQNQPFSTGLSNAFLLDGFQVGPDAEVSLTIMGFEGDAQLGNPPQDSPAIGAQLFCPSCPDFIQVSGGLGTARLNDGVNPQGNLFNGSNNQGGGTHPGLDIDKFELGPAGLGVLTTGNTSLSLVVGSGDGVAGSGNPAFTPGLQFDTAGSGELVMLGYIVLANDTFAPRLDGADTVKTVLQSEAAPGDTLNYTLRVDNSGSAAATAVRVRDQLPAGVTYQAGSTTNTCGVGSGDVGGTSPVLGAAGLNIGNLAVGAECEVRFRVTVNASVAPGTVLQNFFTVEALNHPLITIGPATTTVVGPSIATPLKSVSVIGGGAAIAGAELLYSIRIENDGTANALDLSIAETIPATTENLQILSIPTGAVNASNPGAGTILITGIDVPPGEERELLYTVRIRATTATGTVITNQADVDAAWLPLPVPTDDPAQPGDADPTTILVVSGIALTTSTKEVIDVNGGVVAPGDVLEYRVTIRQTGPIPLTVVVEDSLSQHLTSCQIVTVPLGGFAQCNPGGANGTGRVDATLPVLAGGQAVLVFRATVNTTVDGTQVTNSADLRPLQDPTIVVTVTAPVVTVFARPLFSTSTKSVIDLNGGDVRPGDVLRYTITAVNTGTVAAANLTITDTVPTPLVAVAPIANGGVLAAGVITWTVPTLAVGGNVARTFDATVPLGTLDGTVVTNTAIVDADDPAAPFTTPPVSVTVRATPLLVATKVVTDLTPAPFEPGDVVRYTITVVNNGDGVATDVEIRDPLDPRFVATSFPAGGRREGNDVVFDGAEDLALLSLAPGASATLLFDAELTSPIANGTVVTNQGSVQAANGGAPVLTDDPTTATPNDPTLFTVTSTSTLALTKTFVDVNGGDLFPGDRVTFTLALTAGGNAPATNVTVRDPLDARLTFVSATSGGVFAGGEVRFDATTTPALASVDPGETVTVTFTADVVTPLANGTQIPNQATSESPVAAAVASDDPTTAAPLDPTVLTIVSRPVLDTITKSVVDLDGNGTFAPGDRVRYTIRVENTGSEAATNVVVTDVIPAGLTDVVAADGGVLAGNTITWTSAGVPVFAGLTPLAPVELRFEASIARPLDDFFVIDNQASVSATGIGPDLSDDPATVALDDATRIIVRSHPTLTLEKRVTDTNGAPVEPGDTLTYEIRVRNVGGRTATNVVVTDPIANSLTNVISGQGGQFAGVAIVWNGASTPALAALAIDTETTLTFTAVIVNPLANGTLIDNQASAQPDGVGIPGAPFLSDDPLTAAPLDPTRVQVVSAANLSATILESTNPATGAAIETARPGNAIRYALVVQNTGNAPGALVVVTVPLPPTLSFVSSNGGVLQGSSVVFSNATSPELANVLPGDSIELSFDVVVVSPLDNGTLIDVQGSIDAEDLASPFVTDDPSTAAVSDLTRITIESEANLSLATKAFVDVNGAPVEPGDIVQYVILVTNAGDAAARNIVVTDPLPAGVTFISSSTGGALVGGNVVHTSATTALLSEVLPGAAAVELRIEVQVDDDVTAGTEIANQATVAADGTVAVVTDDPLTAAVDDPTRFTVVTVPRVTFTKDLLSPGGRVLAPGDPLTYVFTVTSVGTATVDAGTLTDTLPLNLVDVVPGPGVTYNAATRAISVTTAALAPDATVSFTLAARVADDATNGTVIQNQASFATPNLGVVLSDDPTTGAADDPTIAVVEAFPDLTASTKVAVDQNGAPLLPADLVRYVITVVNQGNGQAREVVVTDAFDTTNLEIVTIENGGQQNGAIVTWTESTTPALTEIVSGGSVELAVLARVRDTVADGTTIDNQALVDARDVPEPVPTDDPATAATDDPTRVVVAAPVLAFTKSFFDLTDGAPLHPGDAVRYDIVVTNSGSVPASAVTVTDVLPSELVSVVVANDGTLNAGVATWTLGTVAANSSITVRVSGLVDPLALGGDTIANQAQLDFAEGQPIASDDPSTATALDPTVRTIEAAEEYTGTVTLFDAESGDPVTGPVVPGQRIRVHMEMTSAGTQAGQVLTVRIPLNPAFFRLDESDDGGVASPDGTAFIWNASTRPDLVVVLPGETRIFDAIGEIQSPIPDGIVIEVAGKVTSPLTPNEEWTLGPATMTVKSTPSLTSSTKEVSDVNGGLVEPGDILNYRITVLNDGGAEAEDVRVFDPTPPGTVFVIGSLALGGQATNDIGGTELANGMALGDLGSGRSVVVTYSVRVDLSALRGHTIANQAVLRATGIPDAVTDDPLTPLVKGDPTSVIVGGGPLLVVGKTASPASVPSGGTVRYELVIENAGTDVARDVHLVDQIQAPGTYVANSMRIGGAPVTDANDGDAAVFVAGAAPRIEVRRDLLEPGEAMVITLDVVASSGPALLNQAEVTAEGIPLTFSDAVPAAPGAQPLVVTVQGGARTLFVDTNTTTLQDSNGGTVRASDPATARAVVVNRSAEPVALRGMQIELSQLLTVDFANVEIDPRFTFNPDLRILTLTDANAITIAPGESFSTSLRSFISAEALDGETVRAIGRAVVSTIDNAITREVDLGASALTLGLMEGTGALSGTLYIDGDERNGVFDAGTDRTVRGFQVLARPDGQTGAPTRTAVSDENGRYRLLPLPAGVWSVEVRAESGATFLMKRGIVVGAGEIKDDDLRIDPSGVVYRAATYASVRGARVTLYYDDGDADPTNDVIVPDEELLPGQQRQTTTSIGLYRFDPRPGSYRLGIDPPSSLFAFPSSAIPFEQSGESHPFGAVATPAEDGRVVAHATPGEGLDTKYFLRFVLAADAPPVLHNHVPLDALQDAVRITKTANRRKLSMGDIVAYTVRIENPSNGTIDDIVDGGVEIVDTLPEGFRLIPGSHRLVEITRDARGQENRRVAFAPNEGEGRTLRFRSFPLRPNIAWELTYQVVVGPGTRFGFAENRARLLTSRGQVPLTQDAVARVRVVPDPIFDLGTLRAKVFCDDNGDRWQDKGEIGVPGIRIYLDNGHYAESDLTGKLHFTGIIPGMHLAKLDERTLAPGMTVLSDPRASFYISSGLPAQVSFPLTCRFDALDQPTVTVNEDAYRTDAPPKAMRTLHLDGALGTRTLAIDGTELPPLDVDLGVGAEGSEPGFGSAPGPNIPVDKDGAPRARLVFAPRVDSNARVVGWVLTVAEAREELVPVEAGVSDASVDAAGVNDGGTTDGGVGDAGAPDGGASDTGASDGLRRDAGAVDAGATVTLHSGFGFGFGGGDTDVTDAGTRPSARSVDGGAASPADGGALALVGSTTALGDGGVDTSGNIEAPRTRLRLTPVYRFAGEGSPPARIMWDGRDARDQALVLNAGVSYAAVLTVVADSGDEASSAPRPLALAFGEAVAAPTDEAEPERILDSANGPLFDKRRALTKQTKAFADDVAALAKARTGQVVVRVHTDADEKKATSAETAQLAAAFTQALVERGVDEARIDAKGEGDRLPRVPNLRQRDRLQNRRIEVRIVDDRVLEPMPAFTPPGLLLIDGEEAPHERAQGTFSLDVERAVGDVLTVSLQAPLLGKRTVRRVVLENGLMAVGAGAQVTDADVRIALDLAARTARFGERTKGIALLGARLVPERRTADGALFVVDESGAGEAAFAALVPEGEQVTKWTLRVFERAKDAPSSSEGPAAASAADGGVPASDATGAASSDAGPSTTVEVSDAGTPPSEVPSTSAGPVVGEDAGASASEDAGTPAPRPRNEAQTGRMVFEREGQGAPDARLVWDGTGRPVRTLDDDSARTGNDAATQKPPEKSYVARLILENAAGDVVVAPDVPVKVGAANAALTERDTLLVLTDAVDKRGRLNRAAQKSLDTVLSTLRDREGRVVVLSHTDDTGPRLERLARTQRAADAVKKALVARGVDEARVVALGKSSDEPIRPNLSPRTRKENRRVEVLFERAALALASSSSDEMLARVVANGRVLPAGTALVEGDVPASQSGEISLMLTTTQGARGLVRLRPESTLVIAGRPDDVKAQLDEIVLARRAMLLTEVSDAGALDDGGLTSDAGDTANGLVLAQKDPNDGSSFVDAGDTDGGVLGLLARASVDGGENDSDAGILLATVDGSDGGTSTDGGEILSASGSDGGVVDTRTAGATVVRRKAPAVQLPFKDGKPAPAWWPTADKVPAANLSVSLPVEGSVLTSSKLFLHGVTDPTNRVSINGAAVELTEDGRFAHMIELPRGNSEIVVDAVDTMGNRGRISRMVHVDTDGWFVLLLGDTAVGNDGAMLDERSPTTSLTVGDVFVYGRGAAYVNGRFRGGTFFEDYELTLHADTRRWAEEAFVRDVSEPDLLYPVYGDSSLEVQEAQAQYPLYLDFRADQSRIKVGNLRPSLSGGDLLRYQRARYGAEVAFDRGWSQGLGLDREDGPVLLAPAADPWRTQVRAFATTGNENTRHARVELAGTGGSVYFLRHEDLVEGSERAFIIIRDGITAAEIGRAPLARNLDYTMRYGEGRIVLKDPIPTFADMGFLTNHNLGQVRAGHRVYVEVEYDHNSTEPFQGLGAGVEAKQLIWGHAEVGGGYVYEGRADGSPAYQLGGAHAKLFLDQGTFVKAEVALSRSVDAGNFVSYDGGLTYRGLGQSLDQEPIERDGVLYPSERQGWAVKIDAQAELGEYVGRKANDAVVRSYFQRESPGFFAGAAIVEQGQWKWGGEGRYRITDDDFVRLRYDGVIAEIPEIANVSNARILHRQIATAGYERKILRSLTGIAEYGYGYTFDSGAFSATDPDQARHVHTNVIALGLDWQAMKRLAFAVKQEIILTGDGGWVFGHDGTGQLQQWNDHFVTHGQVRYAFTEDIDLQATESVRWNGENQTTVGIGWRVNENSRVYANERFAMQQGGMSTTTVVGGETNFGEGSRTYGEYQLQSGFAGQQTRGVVGLASKMKLPFGLALAFGYERTQVLGGNVSASSTGAVPPGAFSDGTFFAAPGATNGGDYLYGSGSRDSLSGGLEYARGNVRASQRFELRFDNFDEERGGRDRIWLLSMTNFAWTITPELSVLARYNIGLAQDLTLAMREAHLEEGTVGLAYRPITHDWMSALVKFSRRIEVRPLSLKDGTSEEYGVHAFSIEPIVELPWRFQLVEKLAFKHTGTALDDMPRANAYTALWINRINWHALGTVRSFGIDPIIPGEIDLGLEYRILAGLTSETWEHGALVEVQYAPLPYFRIGMGWNFTRFSDNELDRNDTDHSGFFVRAVGQY
jgi:uncharacterized repeat protein (TIGR01451 family)